MPALAEQLSARFDAAVLPASLRDALAPRLEVLTVPAGARVVEEGARDRALYFVLEGHARVERGNVDFGVVRTGEHFGEIALVSDRPRGASVVALSEMVLARLDRAAYLALLGEAPEAGASLLEHMVGAVADRLIGMTDSVGVLIRDRSLPRRRTVSVQVGDETQRARTGAPVQSLLPDAIDGRPVVAALLDRRAVSLATPISGFARVEPLTTAHWEGLRILRRSLGLLVLEAAHRVRPELTVRLGPSLGFAQQIELEGAAPSEALAAELEGEMRALGDAQARLAEELWTVDEAREYFASHGWADSAQLLSAWRDGAVPMASYGEVFVLALGPLMPRAPALDGLRVLRDERGLLLVPGKLARPTGSPAGRGPAEAAARAVSGQTHAMIRTHRRWMGALGVQSVGDFNQACINGDVQQITRVAEGFHEKEVGRIADEIASRRPRVVCVAGPSSSGKTTFIQRLSTQLQVNGIGPLGVSLDDYYVHRVDTPKDARGEYDFEAFEALQVDLLQRQIGGLLDGERVRMARYDFLTGLSAPEGGPEYRLASDHVLLLEGIHGLHPSLLAGIDAAEVFRIFVCPLAQLPFGRLNRVHASDVRLLRRIVRDRHGRNYSAAETIRRWPSVRAGERRHIFPHQSLADVVFDSSLVYEPSVLKVYAERYLLEVPTDDPAYTTAFRLLQLVDRFVAIYPDHVPQTSLLREFIGD